MQKGSFGRRVLLVEDDENLRDLFKFGLEKSGFEVVAAENALRGLEILNSDSAFDLIISDFMMPKMSGTEFFKKVKEEIPGFWGRKILVTGQAGVMPENTNYDLFLRKPFGVAKLVGTINQLLEVEPLSP